MENLVIHHKKTLHNNNCVVLKSIGNSTLNVVGDSDALFF